jgi:integrase/recombinase XerC
MNEIQIYEAAPLATNPRSNLVELLLNDKRSEHTKRAYTRDLCDFFECEEGGELEVSAARFCALSVPEIRLACLNYKTNLRERKLSENTINRRLAAIRSLLKFANRLGLSDSDGSNVAEGEKVTAYRDTKGVDVPTLRKLLAAPEKRFGEKPNSKSSYIDILAKLDISANIDVRAREQKIKIRNEIHLTRDLAVLHLLIENALRRNEVCALDVGDFDASTRSLWILGKGRGNQKERITLSPATVGAIVAYLAESGHSGDLRGALFRNLDPNPAQSGKRLTGTSLHRMIGDYGRFVGLKRLTPHQLRHSSITAALDAGVDVRKVQKLSRHRKLETLLIYDDNRSDLQGEVSGILSGLVTGKKKSRAV